MMLAREKTTAPDEIKAVRAAVTSTEDGSTMARVTTVERERAAREEGGVDLQTRNNNKQDQFLMHARKLPDFMVRDVNPILTLRF